MNQYEWYTTLDNTFGSMWMSSASMLPNIVIALILIFVGYIVAGMLKSIVKRVINTFPVNSMMERAGVTEVVARSGYTLDVGLIFGVLVKWFVLVVFFMAALDVLRLYQASQFLYEVLGYLPHVIVATIILFIGFTLSGIAQNVVAGAARTANFRSADLLGKVARVAIIVFAILAALNQLQIATELVQMLFAGIVFALSLALGLAFGLGGKESAARYLNNLNNRQQ